MQLCFLESFSSDDKKSEILVCALHGLYINKVIQNAVFKTASHHALPSARCRRWCMRGVSVPELSVAFLLAMERRRILVLAVAASSSHMLIPSVGGICTCTQCCAE